MSLFASDPRISIWVSIRSRTLLHQNLVDKKNGEPTNNALSKDNNQDDVINILKELALNRSKRNNFVSHITH